MQRLCKYELKFTMILFTMICIYEVMQFSKCPILITAVWVHKKSRVGYITFVTLNDRGEKRPHVIIL